MDWEIPQLETVVNSCRPHEILGWSSLQKGNALVFAAANALGWVQ